MGIYFVHIIIITTSIKYIKNINGSLSLYTILLMIAATALSIVIVWIFSRNKRVAKKLFLIK